MTEGRRSDRGGGAAEEERKGRFQKFKFKKEIQRSININICTKNKIYIQKTKNSIKNKNSKKNRKEKIQKACNDQHKKDKCANLIFLGIIITKIKLWIFLMFV